MKAPGGPRPVIPFCTHGGGGFGQIENDVLKECSKSKILPGIAVNGAARSEEVTVWLGSIGLHEPSST